VRDGLERAECTRGDIRRRLTDGVASLEEKKTANQDERSIGHEHGGSRTTAPTKSTWPQRILVAFVATNGIGQGLTPTQEPNPLLTD
jgi:hypothetical protein